MKGEKVSFFEIILFIGGLIWVFTTNSSETFWTISISLSLMFLAKSYLIFKGKKDKSIDSKYLNENEEYNNKSKIKGEYTIVYLIDKHGYEHRYSIEESEIPKKWIDFYDDIEAGGNYMFSLSQHVASESLSAGVFRERITTVDAFVGQSILNGSAKCYLVGTKSFEVEVVGFNIRIFKIAR